MTDDLDRYLDGEVGADGLSASTQAHAEAWTRMVESFRTTAPSAVAPAWLEQEIMADIEALPRRGALARMLEWLMNPTPVRVSPLTTALVAAAFTAVLLLPQGRTEVALPAPAAVAGVEPVVYVQFVLEAPGARSVSLAGDFSDWEASVTLADQNEDGLWTARVPVRPGVYSYMFLVDGTEWQTDPRADRYQDDGFGNRNAVLAVAASQ
jgi:hypothetical protein